METPPCARRSPAHRSCDSPRPRRLRARAAGAPPEAASARTLLTTTATVLSSDPERRTLRLRDARTGRAFTVTADAPAADLRTLAPGDVIMLDYFAALSLAPAPPDDAGAPVTAVEEAPSPIGDGLGGVTVGLASAVVDFLGFDPATGEATVRGPDGVVRSLELTPPLTDFARGLAPGDRVLVTLTEAVALSVTPVDR
jgi:hypothetical protein